MVLRIAGGDMNAVIGIIGFIGGIGTGIVFLNKGFSLKRAYSQPAVEGVGLPVIAVMLLVALVAAPSFILFSESGPGSMHAPLLLALAGGLIVGATAQRSRLCFIGGIRDALLFRDFRMLLCFAVILATVLAGNLITGNFNPGFAGQPVAHTEWLWNILGLYLVGFGSVQLGGCPLRQLILAGGGNGDAVVTVLGYLLCAAIVHNFGLASSAAGTTANGRIAFAVCTAVMFIIAILNTVKLTREATA
jgi:YedE family putative selenium metabolism protein